MNRIRFTRRPVLVAALTATILAAAASAGEPEHPGATLWYGSKEIRLDHAVAYVTHHDGSPPATVVVFTAVAPDPAEVTKELAETGRWYPFGDSLRLTFGPDGKLFYVNLHVKDDNASWSTPPEGVSGRVEIRSGRVVGRVGMASPAKGMFGITYRFVAVCDVPLTAVP